MNMEVARKLADMNTRKQLLTVLWHEHDDVKKCLGVALDEIDIATQAIDDLTASNATHKDWSDYWKKECEDSRACAWREIHKLEAERDALKAELDTLKERLTYGPAKAFAEIHALKAEVEILHQNTDTLKTLQQEERELLKAEVAVARERLGPGGYRILVEVATLRAENARLKTVVDAAKEIVHCTDCDLEGDGHMTRLVRAVRALTPATSKETP